jgi:hypothetical protein
MPLTHPMSFAGKPEDKGYLGQGFFRNAFDTSNVLCEKVLRKGVAKRYCEKVLRKGVAKRYCEKVLRKGIAGIASGAIDRMLTPLSHPLFDLVVLMILAVGTNHDRPLVVPKTAGIDSKKRNIVAATALEIKKKL